VPVKGIREVPMCRYDAWPTHLKLTRREISRAPCPTLVIPWHPWLRFRNRPWGSGCCRTWRECPNPGGVRFHHLAQPNVFCLVSTIFIPQWLPRLLWRLHSTKNPFVFVSSKHTPLLLLQRQSFLGLQQQPHIQSLYSTITIYCTLI